MTLQFIDILGLTPGTVAGSNVYPAVDVNDPSQSPMGTTKKYTIGGLFNFFVNQLGFITTPPVIAATTGGNLNAIYNNGAGGVNATLTDNSGTFAPLVIDSVLTQFNQPFLIKNQTLQFQNGIYILTQQGDGISKPWILIRAFYFNSNANIISGELTFVSMGNINANTTWQLSAPPTVIVGTSSLVWNKFSFIPTPPAVFPWVDVTGTAISMIANTGYEMDNAITRVNGALPTSNCPFGSIIEVVGRGNAGWTISQSAGQIIFFNSSNTTLGVGGSLSSVGNRATVRLLCNVANTEFQVISSEGNITVV